ncbi:MAG: hypothetical protein AAF593_05775 [Planctomycetota bacterium]
MRYTRFDFGAACAVGLMLGLVGCGGEDDSAESSPAESGSAEVAAQTLTEEEAAMLAEFRASREAGNSAPADDPSHRSKAAPGASGHAEAVAAIKDESGGKVLYDFDRAASRNRSSNVPAVAPAASAPAGNAPGPDRSSGNPRATPAANTPPNANANTPTVFKKHQVTDPGLNGMVVNTVLVPEDWKVEGGLTRTANQFWYVPFLIDVKYTAPDGRQLHFLPSLSFEFTAQAVQQGAQKFQPINGSLFYPLPETPGSWMMEMARDNPDPSVSNVRLISEEPEPELTKLLQQQSAMMYQSAQQLSETGAQLGMGTAFDTQATVVKVQYTENGIELEESVLIAWQYYVNFSQGQLTGGKWSVSFMVSLRGPVGTDYLNDPELMTVAQSLRVNPQWQAEINKYWQELARIEDRGRRDRDRSWQAHNAKMQQINSETNAIIAGGHATRTAMRDEGFARQIDGIREVSDYNIGGQTVKIPDYYDNVHTDGTGRYILSNDFHYNPNRDLNLPGNWTKVEPQR